jgi:hypothetical protein
MFAFQATAYAPIRSGAAVPAAAGFHAPIGGRIWKTGIFSAAASGQVLPRFPAGVEEYFFHLSRTFNDYIESHSE